MFRSQIAEAFFKRLCKKHKVRSAGTRVSKEDERLKERPEKVMGFVIKVMKEVGIDISNNKMALVTPAMVKWADKIIMMAQKETIPDFLLGNKKMVYWDVEDAKSNSDYKFLVKSREKIKGLVENLVKDIC